jgi:hypothetical protein
MAYGVQVRRSYIRQQPWSGKREVMSGEQDQSRKVTLDAQQALLTLLTLLSPQHPAEDGDGTDVRVTIVI